MRKNILALIGLLSLTVASNASAGLITGDLVYAGTGWSYDTTADTVTLGSGIVLDVSGDLDTTIDVFDPVSAVTPFSYDPFSPSVTIWELGGFTFKLDSISKIIESGTNLVINGAGTMSSIGFDDTAYNWDFSGNNLSFSASNAVPEPSVIALFGLGLLGMGLVGRRKKQA